MIIDKNPIIDELNRTFQVEFNINTNEEISIFINGLAGIHIDDVEDITDNIITVVDGLWIDWTDEFAIMYTKI